MDDRNPETPGRDNESELDRLDQEVVDKNLEEAGLPPLPEATPADDSAPAG